MCIILAGRHTEVLCWLTTSITYAPGKYRLEHVHKASIPILHFYLWRAWNSVVKSTQSTRKLKSIWNLFDIWHASGNMIHVRVVCHCRSRVWRLKAVQMYLTFHHVLSALSGKMHSLWTKLYMDILPLYSTSRSTFMSHVLWSTYVQFQWIFKVWVRNV